MSVKGAHPTDDDIRKIEHTHLSHQDVVVDTVKHLGKINAHSAHRLTLINALSQ